MVLETSNAVIEFFSAPKRNATPHLRAIITEFTLRVRSPAGIEFLEISLGNRMASTALEHG